MSYTHYFDVRIANYFQSDVEDFEEALKSWAKTFKDASALRSHLLSSAESIGSIFAGIEFSETIQEAEE